MSAYPKAKYHKTHGVIKVENEAEEARLEADWVDSPAEFGVITAPSQKQLYDQKFGTDLTSKEDTNEETSSNEGLVDEEDKNLGMFGKRRRR